MDNLQFQLKKTSKWVVAAYFLADLLLFLKVVPDPVMKQIFLVFYIQFFIFVLEINSALLDEATEERTYTTESTYDLTSF